MRIKNILISIGVVILIFFGVRDGLRYWQAYRNQDATPSPTPTPSAIQTATVPTPIVQGNVSVVSPVQNATVALPFTVSGEARVFENTVTIVLEDAEGRRLLHAFTNARSHDTGLFGPYTYTISFLEMPLKGPDVTLKVFWNSPKDGKLLDVVSIPLLLDTTQARTLKTFFVNEKRDLTTPCGVYPVERMIARTTAPATMAMELLLRGPTTAERNAGFFSAIPRGITMPRLTIAQGTATVDFGRDIEEAKGEICDKNAIRSQIEKTLYQFPTISGVIISVEGRVDGIL